MKAMKAIAENHEKLSGPVCHKSLEVYLGLGGHESHEANMNAMECIDAVLSKPCRYSLKP